MKTSKHRLIHREGLPLIVLSALVLICLNILLFRLGAGWIAWSALGISVVILSFFILFFRNPVNIIKDMGDEDILSPADGRVVVVEPAFEDRLLKAPCLQISIFMPITAVHANWYPLNGTVRHVSHRKGRFQAAWLPKSSQENESSSILIEARHGGQTVLLRQIAGAVARRIVTYAHEGDESSLNSQLGFIKFGSRVDLFFPPDSVEVMVRPGDRVKGNQTRIARFKSVAK